MQIRYLLALPLLCLVCSCSPNPSSLTTQPYPALMSEEELRADVNLSGGVYYAYPGPVQQELTPAPTGYAPFYISHYGRHGSRYQPNDKRYVNTRSRLQQGAERGVLTPLGASLLKRIEQLCDSCVGHGGLLTALGAQQHDSIATRMARRFPEVFQRGLSVSARASVVPRCGQSMRAFLGGLNRAFPKLQVVAEVDSAYMAYIAYDTPEMKELSADTAAWKSDYDAYMAQHIDFTPLAQRLFSDATGLDTVQAGKDLYWLVVGMQDLIPDLTGAAEAWPDLSDVMTPEELFACWQCVNYRMNVCNGNAAVGHDIPARSASTLLQNIVATADQAIISDTLTATLRFGHDSNLLRLLCLMRIHNAANRVEDPQQAWLSWQENRLSPMAGNLQLVFYRPTSGPVRPEDYLVKTLLNENEVLYDVPALEPVSGPYYRWSDLRMFFMMQLASQD